MSNYPTSLDDDVTLPRVDDNLTEIGGEAINALRDATFNQQAEIGIGASGTAGSIADRLSVALDPAGNIKLSALSLLPQLNNIVDAQVSPTASIKESKLQLDHSTASLYNYIGNFNTSLNTALNFIINSGSKLEPHLQGITYRHDLFHIDVAASNSLYFKDKSGLFRNNSNLYTLLSDINTDFVNHQKSNGSTGEIPPTNYGHVAAGISLKANSFASIPQTTTDVQKFADYLDGAGVLTIGSRIQTLYQNGIPKASRASTLIPYPSSSNSLSSIKYGQAVIPITTVTTYLLNSGNVPFDDIDTGDDIVEFTPDTAVLTNNLFDSQFAAVKTGDIISINYGNVIAPFIIKEVKYVVSGGNKRFLVRINGKNLSAGTANTARIDKSLFNTNKYGSLSLAVANSPINNVLPSLIVGSPRGAQFLGIGFDPNLLDANHYNLYLVLYPSGNPSDGLVNMAAVDVTGNNGATPGFYTLESVVYSLNVAFRRPGFNFRFIAFSYQGNIGIMLADSVNNASFSVIAGVLGPSGAYDQGLSNTSYPLNVVDIFNNVDPFGFGPNGANIASSPYATSFSPVIAAQNPTKLVTPLSKHTYFVNGAEKEKLNTESNQLIDENKDGYWPATITSKLIVAGARVQVTYTISGYDLSASGLKIGKTLVVQSASGGTVVDFGRFYISNVEFNLCDGNVPTTKITVYDAVHSVGASPYVSSGIGTAVRIYFSADSVGFNIESATDILSSTNYKRNFEVYINENGSTFTHERARLLNGSSNATVNGVTVFGSSELSNINFYKVSSKIRGYVFSSIKKINLQITSYDSTSGVFDGYLCRYDGYTSSNFGPSISGKRGEVVRFYDETHVDYLDLIFDASASIATFSTTKNIDIQLFPSLSLDDDVFLLGTCQVNDLAKEILYLRDEREFGNVSEKQLSNSAFAFINSGNKYLHQNGVVRGFDITSTSLSNKIIIRGGMVLLDGNFVNMNNAILSVPLVQELYSSTIYTKINWALCVNSKNEYEFVALTDYDSTSPATPNAAGRIIIASNPLNSQTYPIDSRSFAEIIADRKDLTILYKFSSTVNNSGALTALSYNDARKYVYESTSLIDPVLTSEGSQGSFYNFDSLAMWVNYNTNYCNNIGIKGNATVSGIYSFSNNYVVKFNGNNVSTLTFSSGSNVTFTNFHFNEVPIVINSGASVTFVNCVFDPTSVTISSGSTVTFTSCIFDTVSLTLNASSTFNSCKFNNTNITLNQAITLNSATQFEKSNIIVSVVKGIIINSDDISFDKCNFTYTFDSSADVNYTSGNNVNTAAGMIYGLNNSSFQRKNLHVTNCKFTSTTTDHYPFISIEFNHIDSHYQDILIENNRFYSSTGSDDTRSAIVFANNVITGLTTLQGPRLVNTFIKNNIFDKNQIIAITTIKDGSNNINNALSLINCSIERNTCGAILYTSRYETKRNFANSSNLVRDKESLLLIEGNVCRYIGAGYSSGTLLIETGKVIINKNSLSAIVNDIAYSSNVNEKRASLTITENNFAALPTSEFGFSAYAINVSGYNVTSNPTGVIISKNIFDFGTSVASNGTSRTDGYYTSGNIYCNAPSIITDNILKGVGNSTMSPLQNSLVYAAGNTTITGNSFFRGSLSLGSDGYYIFLSNSQAIVTNNSFDATTTDGTSEILLMSSGTSKVVYEKNKNQISYVTVSLFSGAIEKFEVSPFDYYLENYSNATEALQALRHGSPSGPIDVSPTQNLILNVVGDDKYHTFVTTIDISSILPNGVQILAAKAGICSGPTDTGTISSESGHNYFGRLYSIKNQPINFASGTNSILDPKSILLSPITEYFTTVVINSSTLSNMRTVTQYLALNTISNTDRFINDGNNSIYLQAQFVIVLDTGTQSFIFSPFVIKYRW